MITIQGKGVSAGVGVGPLYFYRRATAEIKRYTVEDTDAEWHRFKGAQTGAIEQLGALAEQARRDGDGLVREAQNAVKVLENEAMQRAGEAGQAADAALRSDAERTCTAIRQQAEQRMDTAVRAIVDKVVKR